MRKLKMSDIRVSNGIVFAAPIWAYETEPWRYNGTDQYDPIKEIWQPILDVLDRQHGEVEARLEARFRAAMDRATDQTLTEEEQKEALEDLRFHVMAKNLRAAAPHYLPSARLKSPTYQSKKNCVVCKGTFYGFGNTWACTEKCASARRAATRTRGNTPRPHVLHDERLCPQCHEAFRPRRSDAVFCSARCRVYHYRDQDRAGGENR